MAQTHWESAGRLDVARKQLLGRSCMIVSSSHIDIEHDQPQSQIRLVVYIYILIFICILYIYRYISYYITINSHSIPIPTRSHENPMLFPHIPMKSHPLRLAPKSHHTQLQGKVEAHGRAVAPWKVEAIPQLSTP